MVDFKKLAEKEKKEKKGAKPKATPAESAQLPAEIEPGGGELVSEFDLASPAGMDQLLADHAVRREHAGGSLPVIKFEGRPKAFVARFLGVSHPEEQQFTVANWRVLDASRLFAGVPEADCALGVAQTINGHAMRAWTSIVEPGTRDVIGPNPGNVGKLVCVKYLGEMRREDGSTKAPLKLVTIEELQPPVTSTAPF